MYATPRIRDGRLSPRPLRRGVRLLGRLLVGRVSHEPRHCLVRRAFLGALALTYAAAFGSLAVQVDGLVGRDGILPAVERLAAVEGRWGSAPWGRLPTLFWFGAGDFALHVMTWGGVLIALLALLGMAPRLLFALLWVGYLSLVNVCGVFTSYQWDALLLEAGLLAVPFAPAGLWPTWRGAGEPSRVGLFLLRWLLFRLMFLSGLAKLVSGDAAWGELRALDYHFWTQPLPDALAWSVNQLPGAVLRFGCAAALLIEAVVPLLVFAPQRLRTGACVLFLLLLGGITLTGNYGFFTLLAAALCVTLLDDALLLRLLPGRMRSRLLRVPVARPERRGAWRQRLALALAVPVVLLTAAQGLQRLHAIDRLPPPLRALDELQRPFHAFNAYGLFEVMTTERPEVLVEGSLDGERWEPYEFRWKPGNPARRPGFAGPHMPRLDWQMWFAALYGYDRSPWFARFQDRLLSGDRDVLELLRADPFDGQPPRYVRATLWRYRFTTADEKRASGAYWVREPVEPFGPVRGGTLPGGR